MQWKVPQVISILTSSLTTTIAAERVTLLCQRLPGSAYL